MAAIKNFPDPTPWTRAQDLPAISGDRAEESPLGKVDDIVASDQAGVLVVDGSARELAAVAEHVVRRAESAGRRCIVADGRIVDEPWRELATMFEIEPTRPARDVARALLRAAGDAVIVVHEARATAWGTAVVEAVIAHRRDKSRDFGPTVVLLTSRRVDRAARVSLSAVASGQDLSRFYDALIEASRARVASFGELAQVQEWWQGASRDLALSKDARGLAMRLMLLERSCDRGLLAELGSREGCSELCAAGALRIDGERAVLTSPVHPIEEGHEAAVAEALLDHATDAWATMRAAELFAAAGQTTRAHEAAMFALRDAPDAALRSDLWDRFDQALGEGLDERHRVAYGELALAGGDIEQALRVAQRADSKQSYASALMIGRITRARGDVGASERALSDALSLAQDQHDRAVAEVELAELRLAEGKRDDARAHAERAYGDIAGQDIAIALMARNVSGKVLLSEGRWDEAVSHFAADEKQASSQGRSLDALRARLNRAIGVMSQGRRLEAHALLESILEEGERLRERRAIAFALANMSTFAALGHDYAEALRLVERAIEEMRVMGDAFKLARQILNLAELRLRVGMVDEAEQALAFGRQACGPNLGDALVTMMSLVTAKAYLARGNTLHASVAVDEAIATSKRSNDGAKLGEACRLAARVALEDGDVARAERYLDRAKKAASGPDSAVELALLEAMVARAAGRDFSQAAEIALALAEDADELDFSRQAHELSLNAARLLGDSEAARRHLLAAVGLRERVAATLPEHLKASFLGRRDLQALAEIERDAACDDAVTIDAPPTRRSGRPAASRPSQRPQRQMIGETAAMKALRQALAKIGPCDATVLIGGESGTGKELVANAIHQQSHRSSGPLVKVNCAALVETLLLSELFGHEKGAFTGAAARKRGRFEQAHGGTIFLDEIGDISPKTQVALLRVMQERCFERVGGTTAIDVDVRVVCATHRDLHAMVEQGTFREDLYYRLCGVTVEVPALRQRLADLPLLCDALLERIAAEQGLPRKELRDDALEGLARHGWPGNVRELENALKAATLFADGPLVTLRDFTDNVATLSHLAAPPSSAPVSATRRSSITPSDAVYAEVRAGKSLPEMKRDLERICIERALEEAQGNITKAAEILGMKRPRVSQLVNQFARGEEVES